MVNASLYRCEVRHARTEPLQHSFRYRTYQWLVDLDDLPTLPRWLQGLARFEARDHLGDPDAAIRTNVDRFLASRGVNVQGGRVVLLTNARVCGHVFNPLSVFWCYDRQDALAAVIAEVHNTYHELHCYLLHPDPDGNAGTEKEFYVSPFFPVDGRYSMSVPEPGAEVNLTVTLHRGPAEPFTAQLRGRRLAATPWSVLATALRHPMAPLAVSLRIRRQGLALYVRGLRPHPRPLHLPQEGSS